MKTLKTYLQTLVFLMFFGNISAQYESVFGTTYTEWNFISMTCDATFVDTYIQEKDTTISGVVYKLIDGSGMMRESDSNSKLWFRDINSQEEQLIMDLNLQVGDTFFINDLELYVDTIFIEDNYKFLEFDHIPPYCGSFEKFRFVEGRGPNLDFHFVGDEKSLRCQTKDTITINYLNDDFGDDCRQSPVSTNEINQDKSQIFPNPFSDQITIEFENSQLRQIHLYDIMGRRLISNECSKRQVEIETRSIQTGIYFIQITSKDNEETKQVIKM